jgi:uncharacterized protein YggE
MSSESPTSAPPTVTVAGSGRATRAADVADTTFVVEALRPTAAEARSTAAGTAAAVLDALRAAGVADADLHTAGLDLSPSWEHDGTRMVRTGFTVTNRIAATVRDLDAVGRVLDAGLGAGATGLDGVRFRVADEAAASEEARRAAVADARRRATTIAEALGGGLGALISVSEGTPAGPLPRREAKLAFAAAAADAPTPVLPGAVEVTVTVTASWGLRPGAG